MKNSRRAGCSRKNRKASRKASRKNRKANRRSNRQSGGWVVLNPAAIGGADMKGPSEQNLAQGGEYKEMHKGQYGGGAPLEGAPVGSTGMLDSSLRAAAHLGPLDKSLAAIQGMSDQAGGARRSSKRKGSRKSRKASRKGRKASRKNRKASRKSSRKNRMRGGAALNPADANAPGTLLPAGLESKALATMNPEWKLAEDPASFAPKA